MEVIIDGEVIDDYDPSKKIVFKGGTVGLSSEFDK